VEFAIEVQLEKRTSIAVFDSRAVLMDMDMMERNPR
jgi:hypothetical protein